MTDEKKTTGNGPDFTTGDRIGRSGLTRRYDQLIAAAEGDPPLREFWSLGKRLFQARSEAIPGPPSQ